MAKASAETDENIHEFNARFEQSIIGTSTEISDLWVRFENHLLSQPDTETGAYWIQHFSGSVPGTRLYDAAPEKLPAFCGPQVLPRGRTLSTQQAFLSITPALSAELPHIAPEIAELGTAIHNAPGRSPSRPLGARGWATWYDEVMRKSEAVKSSVVRGRGVRSPLVSGPSARPVSAPRRSAGHDRLRVMWFTFADDLDAAIGRLPSKTPLGRAAAATYRRLISGVFNAKDAVGDLDFISGNPDVAGFRVVLDVRVKLAVVQENEVRQPTIFAQGDPKLFVSEETDSVCGGRTARLPRTGCGHVSGRCKCYKQGLPEVVTSRAVAMAADEIEIRDVAILMHRHLKWIAAPDTEELRRQKVAERSAA